MTSARYGLQGKKRVAIRDARFFAEKFLILLCELATAFEPDSMAGVLEAIAFGEKGSQRDQLSFFQNLPRGFVELCSCDLLQASLRDM